MAFLGLRWPSVAFDGLRWPSVVPSVVPSVSSSDHLPVSVCGTQATRLRKAAADKADATRSSPDKGARDADTESPAHETSSPPSVPVVNSATKADGTDRSMAADGGVRPSGPPRACRALGAQLDAAASAAGAMGATSAAPPPESGMSPEGLAIARAKRMAESVARRAEAQKRLASSSPSMLPRPSGERQGADPAPAAPITNATGGGSMLPVRRGSAPPVSGGKAMGGGGSKRASAEGASHSAPLAAPNVASLARTPAAAVAAPLSAASMPVAISLTATHAASIASPGLSPVSAIGSSASSASPAEAMSTQLASLRESIPPTALEGNDVFTTGMVSAMHHFQETLDLVDSGVALDPATVEMLGAAERFDAEMRRELALAGGASLEEADEAARGSAAAEGEADRVRNAAAPRVPKGANEDSAGIDWPMDLPDGMGHGAPPEEAEHAAAMAVLAAVAAAELDANAACANELDDDDDDNDMEEVDDDDDEPDSPFRSPSCHDWKHERLFAAPRAAPSAASALSAFAPPTSAATPTSAVSSHSSSSSGGARSAARGRGAAAAKAGGGCSTNLGASSAASRRERGDAKRHLEARKSESARKRRSATDQPSAPRASSARTRHDAPPVTDSPPAPPSAPRAPPQPAPPDSPIGARLPPRRAANTPDESHIIPPQSAEAAVTTPEDGRSASPSASHEALKEAVEEAVELLTSPGDAEDADILELLSPHSVRVLRGADRHSRGEPSSPSAPNSAASSTASAAASALCAALSAAAGADAAAIANVIDSAGASGSPASPWKELSQPPPQVASVEAVSTQREEVARPITPPASSPPSGGRVDAASDASSPAVPLSPGMDAGARALAYAPAAAVEVLKAAMAEDDLEAVEEVMEEVMEESVDEDEEAAMEEAAMEEAAMEEAAAVEAAVVEAAAVEAVVEASAMEAAAVEAGAVVASAMEAAAVEAGAVQASAMEAAAVEAAAVEAEAVAAAALEAVSMDSEPMDDANLPSPPIGHAANASAIEAPTATRTATDSVPTSPSGSSSPRPAIPTASADRSDGATDGPLPMSAAAPPSPSQAPSGELAAAFAAWEAEVEEEVGVDTHVGALGTLTSSPAQISSPAQLSSAPLFASAPLGAALGDAFPPGSHLAAILAEEQAFLADEDEAREAEQEARGVDVEHQDDEGRMWQERIRAAQEAQLEHDDAVATAAASRDAPPGSSSGEMDIDHRALLDAHLEDGRTRAPPADMADNNLSADANHAAGAPAAGMYDDDDADDVPYAMLELQPEVAMIYMQQLLSLGLVRLGLPEVDGGEACRPIHGDTLQVSLESFLFLETELERTAPTGTHRMHCAWHRTHTRACGIVSTRARGIVSTHTRHACPPIRGASGAHRPMLTTPVRRRGHADRAQAPP